MKRTLMSMAAAGLLATSVIGALPTGTAEAAEACPSPFQLIKLKKLQQLGYTFSGKIDLNGNGLVCAKGAIGTGDIVVVDDRG
jgi:hypothetical protein